jgi:hypothetical protein
MPDFIVIRSQAGGYTASWAEGEDEESAATSLGGHFVHVLPDNGEESVVFDEGTMKVPLLVHGRPEKKAPEPKTEAKAPAQPEPAKPAASLKSADAKPS